MLLKAFTSFVLAVAILGSNAAAQGVRDFTRPKTTTPASLTESQAEQVTLTLTDAQFRPIQTWVRAVGVPDKTGKVLTISVKGAQANLLQPGQRLRAFSVNSRSQMQQGRVKKVIRTSDGALVEAELAGVPSGNPAKILVEIVTEAGPFLSIPNVSIIEEEGEKIVYLQQTGGGYLQRPIKTGIQGELYTQVTEGLAENDEVVSVGSFFVDAETKLKSTGGMLPMPGMDHGAMPMPEQGGAPATGPLKLTMSEPEASSTVGAPMMVHLMFNKPVDAAKTTIEITSASGARVQTDAPAPMGKGGAMLMVMPAARLSPGGYKVKWRTAGLDGATLDGEFSFKVK